MTTGRPVWGADVPVSMPLPAPEPKLVPMFGLSMTQFRLVHDISATEYEELRVPVFAPPAQNVSQDDAAIDAAAS